MKIKFYIYLLTTVFFIITSQTMNATTCPGVEIKPANLNVRSTPSLGTNVVGTVRVNQRYHVTGSHKSWYKIQYDHRQVWVHKNHVTYGIYRNCIVVDPAKVSALNIRSGAGLSYRIVGTANSSSRWFSRAISGSWNKIAYQGRASYGHKAYFKDSDATTASPSVFAVSRFALNSGATNTISRFVTASVQTSKLASYYQVSEDPNFAGASWLRFTSTPQIELSPANGIKRVYYRIYHRLYGISVPVSDVITLQIPNSSTRSINSSQFFNHYRNQFGALTQSKTNGINFLLANIVNDDEPATNNLSVWQRQIAYVFATTKHEVADTYLPITEFSNTHCVNYDGGCRYKGRGYVQLTHRYNYQTMSGVTGVDLVANPELALDPDIAYHVMSFGMHNGSFTTRRLGDYINNGKTDYYNARRVVNGTDKASLIKGYAEKFQTVLQNSSN